MKMMTIKTELLQESEIKNRAESYLDKIKKSIENIKITSSFSQATQEIAFSKEKFGPYTKNRPNTVKIVTTGMGKAGASMRKFSSTLCSLGFSSCYLHPGEASHGDLGIIQNGDILFVASTSGKTREVIETIELAKNMNLLSKVIGITSHKDSPIKKLADITIDMGEIEEIGDLGLAPTSSIIVMTAITDCLAIIASEISGLTSNEYAKTHHGGYCGQKARGDNNIF